MNWGHKIAIAIGIFLLALTGMVVLAFQQTNEMVDDNYYQKELEYQSIIDAQQNLVNITTDNMVRQDRDELIFTFPSGSYEKFEKGTIELLRHDSKKKDMLIDIQLNGFDNERISKKTLSKGVYKARIKWVSDGKDFYREESVFVE